MTYLTENLPLTEAKAKEFILNNKDTWAADYQRWASSSDTSDTVACDSVRAAFQQASRVKNQEVLNLLSNGYLEIAFKRRLKTDPLHEIFLRNSKQEPWSTFNKILDSSTQYRIIIKPDRTHRLSIFDLIKAGREIVAEPASNNISQTLKKSPKNKLAFLAAIADAQYNKDTAFLEQASERMNDITQAFGAHSTETGFVKTALKDFLPAAKAELLSIKPHQYLQPANVTAAVTVAAKSKGIKIGRFQGILGTLSGLAVTTLAVLGITGFNPFNNMRPAQNPSQPSPPVAAAKITPAPLPPTITEAKVKQVQKNTPLLVTSVGLDDATKRIFKKTLGITITDGQAARQTAEFEKRYGINIDIIPEGTTVSLQEKNGTPHLLIIGVNREIYSVPVNEEIATQFKKPEAKQISSPTPELTAPETTGIAFQFKAHQARG